MRESAMESHNENNIITAVPLSQESPALYNRSRCGSKTDSKVIRMLAEELLQQGISEDAVCRILGVQKDIFLDEPNLKSP